MDVAAERRRRVRERVKKTLDETLPDPTVRQPTQPKLWQPAVRAARLEYYKLGGPKTGGVEQPAHKHWTLTPGRLAKLVGRRPNMTTTELTEWVGQRYRMAGETMKNVHNRILCRKFAAHKCAIIYAILQRTSLDNS